MNRRRAVELQFEEIVSGQKATVASARQVKLFLHPEQTEAKCGSWRAFDMYPRKTIPERAMTLCELFRSEKVRGDC